MTSALRASGPTPRGRCNRGTQRLTPRTRTKSPRSAVINSYQAAETLANVVFKNLKKAQLLGAGSAEQDAETTAEQERNQHRTEASFLLHRGLDASCGRSLFKIRRWPRNFA